MSTTPVTLSQDWPSTGGSNSAQIIGVWFFNAGLIRANACGASSAIPITEELHTTAYVNGRGRISKNIPSRHIHDGPEYWKDFGREVAHECLETLRCAEGLSLGAVYCRGKPDKLAQTKRNSIPIS